MSTELWVIQKFVAAIFFTGKLFGQFPIHLDRKSTPPKARVSILLMLYSAFFVLLSVMLSVWTYFRAFRWGVAAKDDALRELLMNFVSAFQSVVPLVKAKDYVVLATKFQRPDSESAGNFGWTSHTVVRTIKLLISYAVFLYILPTIVTLVYTYTQDRSEGYVPLLIYFSAKFGTFVQDSQLMVMVANLRAQTKQLNDTLNELLDQGGAAKRGTSHWGRNCISAIQDTRAQHFRISEQAHVVESAYSPQLLVSLAIFFVDASFTLYHLLVAAVYEKNLGTKYTFETVFRTYWLVISLIEIVTVISVCDDAVSESAQTSHIIRQLSWNVQDPRLQSEVEAFWLQTQHQPVCYRAGGYLHMNYKLIYKMVRLMASYLLLATQLGAQHTTTTAAA